jgi:hypothetical protein
MSEYSSSRRRRVRTSEPSVSAPLAHYRKAHPLEPKTPSAVYGGRMRVLYVPHRPGVDAGRSASLESFSLAEAAEALGRSLITFRKWIQHNLIPAPLFKDVVKGNFCYTIQEIEAIAAGLVEHERSFVYLGVTHRASIARIRRAVDEARWALLRGIGFLIQ